MSLYEKIIKKEEKIALVGLGYVGMPIAVEFAKHVDVIGFDINKAKVELYKQGICSVFVECGGTLAGAFLKENLIDEIYQFIAPKILNDNEGKSCFNGDNINEISEAKELKIYEVKHFTADILIKSTIE